MKTRKAAPILLFTLLACGGSETREPVQGDFTPTGKQLSVRGQSLTSCLICRDGSELAYQTPKGLHAGLKAVELLQEVDDPNPHLLWREGIPLDVDLVEGAMFCAVDVGSIPPGSYSHLRVTLDYAVFEVDATAHLPGGMLVPGSLLVDYAVSDYESFKGPRIQGEYTATFTAFGQSMSQSGRAPVDYPPPYPDGIVEVKDGSYQLAFTIPQASPIVIDHEAPASVDVSVTFHIEDAFAWRDTTGPQFKDGVFDLTSDLGESEQPVSMSIQGLTVEVSRDSDPNGFGD